MQTPAGISPYGHSKRCCGGHLSARILPLRQPLASVCRLDSPCPSLEAPRSATEPAGLSRRRRSFACVFLHLFSLLQTAFLPLQTTHFTSLQLPCAFALYIPLASVCLFPSVIESCRRSWPSLPLVKPVSGPAPSSLISIPLTYPSQPRALPTFPAMSFFQYSHHWLQSPAFPPPSNLSLAQTLLE